MDAKIAGAAAGRPHRRPQTVKQLAGTPAEHGAHVREPQGVEQTPVAENRLTLLIEHQGDDRHGVEDQGDVTGTHQPVLALDGGVVGPGRRGEAGFFGVGRHGQTSKRGSLSPKLRSSQQM